MSKTLVHKSLHIVTSLFLILFIFVQLSLSGFAVSQYLLTLICVPDFEWDDYDVITVRLVNAETGEGINYELPGYNNFVLKVVVDEGEYYLTEVHFEGRSDIIFENAFQNISIHSNTTIQVPIKDSKIIIPTTTTIPSTTANAITLPSQTAVGTTETTAFYSVGATTENTEESAVSDQTMHLTQSTTFSNILLTTQPNLQKPIGTIGIVVSILGAVFTFAIVIVFLALRKRNRND